MSAIPTKPDDSLEWALNWIDLRRFAIHEADCTTRRPSAQCSCGLHRVLSILRQINNENPGIYAQFTTRVTPFNPPVEGGA